MSRRRQAEIQAIQTVEEVGIVCQRTPVLGISGRHGWS
jgi:hypothetical protein